jgi:hypothetical protein
MGNLLDLIRERRRRGPDREVTLISWESFSEDAPCTALGLEQAPDEPFELFIERVIAAAQASEIYHVWLDNITECRC